MKGYEEAEEYYQKNSSSRLLSEVLPEIRKVTSVYDEFLDLDEAYERAVHNEAVLIRKIAGERQSREIYLGIFKYLYANGVFSLNDDFTFDMDNEEICCNFGLSIIDGHGVCRNIASHFMDVLYEIDRQKQGDDAFLLVSSRVSNNDIALKHLPKGFRERVAPRVLKLSKEIDDDMSDTYSPNHVQVLYLTNGKLRVYDPVLFSIIEVNPEKKATERRAFNLNFNIYRKGFITDPCEFLKMADRNLVELEESEKKVLSGPFHEEIMRYAIDRCRSSSEDIQDFWNRTDKYYKIISEEKQKCYRKVSQL